MQINKPYAIFSFERDSAVTEGNTTELSGIIVVNSAR